MTDPKTFPEKLDAARDGRGFVGLYPLRHRMGSRMNSQIANLAAMYFAGFFTAWMLIERR